MLTEPRNGKILETFSLPSRAFCKDLLREVCSHESIGEGMTLFELVDTSLKGCAKAGPVALPLDMPLAPY